MKLQKILALCLANLTLFSTTAFFTSDACGGKDMEQACTKGTSDGIIGTNQENNPNTQNIKGNTPLHLAVKNNNIQEARSLLLTHRANPNIQNDDGNTPLHTAAFYNRTEITKLLLDKDADPNIQNNRGDIPLHTAAFFRRTEITKLLLDKGANPNAQDDSGNTPLHHAITYDNIETIKLLLNHSANPNIQNDDGDTPLHFAPAYDNIEIIELLLNYKADPAIRNYKGETYQDSWPPIPLNTTNFPQDRIQFSLENNDKKECPICFEKSDANNLCYIFNCPPSENYPFGHHLCIDCANSLLNETHQYTKCPLCQNLLKRYNY